MLPVTALFNQRHEQLWQSFRQARDVVDDGVILAENIRHVFICLGVVVDAVGVA